MGGKFNSILSLKNNFFISFQMTEAVKAFFDSCIENYTGT